MSDDSLRELDFSSLRQPVSYTLIPSVVSSGGKLIATVQLNIMHVPADQNTHGDQPEVFSCIWKVDDLEELMESIDEALDKAVEASKVVPPEIAEMLHSGNGPKEGDTDE